MDKPAEKVEVKRVLKQDEQRSPFNGLYGRFYKAIFPILGGLILDFADLATWGPVGLFTGMIVGCTVGWLISGIYDFSKNGRILCSVLSGIYCTVPGTFFLPLATFIAATARFRQKPKSSPWEKNGNSKTH